MVVEFGVAPPSSTIASVAPATTSSWKPPKAPSHSPRMPTLRVPLASPPPVSSAVGPWPSVRLPAVRSRPVRSLAARSRPAPWRSVPPMAPSPPRSLRRPSRRRRRTRRRRATASPRSRRHGRRGRLLVGWILIVVLPSMRCVETVNGVVGSPLSAASVARPGRRPAGGPAIPERIRRITPTRPSGDRTMISSTISPTTVLNRASVSPIVLAEREIAHVVVGDDEHERAEPRAFEVGDAADHGDDQQVDRRADRDRGRIDLTVPPDVEHAGDPGDEAGERERERAVQRRR